LQETNDVKLIGMMNDIFSSINDVREVGKKFAVVESTKAQKSRQSAREFADYGGSQHASLGNVGDIHSSFT
jgi:COP9 signalosome complex subunit 6